MRLRARQGIASQPAGLLERERLQQQITTALEQLAAFQERAGQLPEAERSIRRVLELDPLSESAYRQLMLILARADQRSAALEAYDTCRRMLATELGLAPAVETVMLAEQIRGLAPFESHAAQAALPPVLTRFFGRQPESARLVDFLSRRTVRLVTLAGPGGVGKTRLAIEVAHRMAGVFAHDICFVELAGVADERSVHDAVAAVNWEGVEHLSPRRDMRGNDFVAETAKRIGADFTMIHRDNWVNDHKIGETTPLAAWFPIDSSPVPAVIKEHMSTTRWNATMSQWACNQAKTEGYAVTYLPHSYDSTVFMPIEKRTDGHTRISLRQKMHNGNIPDDAYLITMVAANKGWPPRKGFGEAFEAVAAIQKRRKDVWLYIHALPTNEEGGPELKLLAQSSGLDMKRVRLLDPWVFYFGVEPEELAAIYQSSDLFLNPIYGEGFGIPMSLPADCKANSSSIKRLGIAFHRLNRIICADLVY